MLYAALRFSCTVDGHIVTVVEILEELSRELLQKPLPYTVERGVNLVKVLVDVRVVLNTVETDVEVMVVWYTVAGIPIGTSH